MELSGNPFILSCSLLLISRQRALASKQRNISGFLARSAHLAGSPCSCQVGRTTHSRFECVPIAYTNCRSEPMSANTRTAPLSTKARVRTRHNQNKRLVFPVVLNAVFSLNRAVHA